MYGRQKLRCQICHYINKTFDFVPPRAFDFDQKLTQNAAQVILYYHVTKQFLPGLI